MGLFDKLISAIRNGRPAVAAQPDLKKFSQEDLTVVATYVGSSKPNAYVSDTEVADRVKAYSYVLTTDPPALKAADQWWNDETHKSRVREGSDLAYAWLLPFMPLETARLEQLLSSEQSGPHGAGRIAKELRAIIRARRKSKQPYKDLLVALYGVSTVLDLSGSLAFEGVQPHFMSRFVSLTELQATHCEYAKLGYLCSESLSKTDIKWLVEVLGEPSEHQSFNAAFPHIQCNAISRYCWAELHRENQAFRGLGTAPKTMQHWLNDVVKRNIGYHKEWQERVAARQIQLEERSSALDAAWAATRETFVVADLETTGLQPASDQILEFAAIRVDPSGLILAEFSALVRVKQPLPEIITNITGIKQADIDREGRPLKEAMADFLAFVGLYPVFFHNAPFDVGFLKQTGVRTNLRFSNAVHDTLPIAWAVWPSLGTYKLGILAAHVGAPAPVHRGLSDAKAALAILMAARAKTQRQAAT